MNKATAQVEADASLRKERQPRRTLLESAGQRRTATSLEALEDEVRTRHAELVKKFPQRGPEYEAGMKTSWLDGKHVVFGKVTDGMDVVTTIESKGNRSGQPMAKVTIADCGQLS